MTALDKYLIPARRQQKRLWILSAACIFIAVGITRDYIESEGRAVQLEQVAAKLQLPPPAKPRLSKAEVQRYQEWSKLAIERSFNWYPIFKALERASSDDIELLAFEPDKANGQFVLRGEAKSMEALVAYLARLSEQKTIGRAYLTRQQTSERQSLKTLAFEIRASLVK